jgi:hypothetical protein
VIIGVRPGLQLIHTPLYDDPFGSKGFGVIAVALLVSALVAAVLGNAFGAWLLLALGAYVGVMAIFSHRRDRRDRRSLPAGLRELDLPEAKRYTRRSMAKWARHTGGTTGG